MVSKHMSLTGGLGQYPWNEGFGEAYDLDPEVAYNETCAAIASILWSQNLLLMNNDAQYADLIEWQLYNAALVGIGITGETYLYNNPLEVNIDIQRRSWYSVPCCPSNLSRLIERTPEFSGHINENTLFIDQYYPCDTDMVKIESNAPFGGKVLIVVKNPQAIDRIKIRIPSWAVFEEEYSLKINGNKYLDLEANASEIRSSTGYDPARAFYMDVTDFFTTSSQMILEFELPVISRHPHPKSKSLIGKVAYTRGPLVYCAETVDNQFFDPKNTRIKEEIPSLESTNIKNIDIISFQFNAGSKLKMIPYMLWGNRGRSKMSVWLIKE